MGIVLRNKSLWIECKPARCNKGPCVSLWNGTKKHQQFFALKRERKEVSENSRTYGRNRLVNGSWNSFSSLWYNSCWHKCIIDAKWCFIKQVNGTPILSRTPSEKKQHDCQNCILRVQRIIFGFLEKTLKVPNRTGKFKRKRVYITKKTFFFSYYITSGKNKLHCNFSSKKGVEVLEITNNKWIWQIFCLKRMLLIESLYEEF